MFNKLVVAIDGSENSLQALDYAAQIAAQNNASLHIVSVVEPISSYYPLGASLAYNEVHEKTLTEYYKKIHKEQKEKVTQEYPEIQIYTEVKTGKPVNIIIETASDSDLIVVGHRGQGAILTWVLGSVARQVVDKCSVPVLVVKDKEFCKM